MSKRSVALAMSLALVGCSSPGVTVVAARPDETLKALSSIFVVVGSAKDLALADPAADAMELVAPAKQEHYEATLQFEPRKDAKGRLVWNKVLDRQKSAKPRVEAEIAPLAVDVDKSLFDEIPDLELLVLANFQSGRRVMRPVTRQQFDETKRFVFELQGEEIKQR